MKVRLIQKCGRPPTPDNPKTTWQIGEVLEAPWIYKLVRLGVAVPADEECAQAVDMTPEQLATVQHAASRVAKGIHPDDYQAFDQGRMSGYNPDGSWVPGPNADTEDEDDEDE